MLRATDRVVVTLRPATVSRVSWWRRFPASSTSSSSRRTRPCPSSQPCSTRLSPARGRGGRHLDVPRSHCSAERGPGHPRVSFRKTANWTVRSVRPWLTAAMPVRAWCSEPACAGRRGCPRRGGARHDEAAHRRQRDGLVRRRWAAGRHRLPPGKRTLRLLDYGKLAATFLDEHSGRAVRMWPAAETCASG